MVGHADQRARAGFLSVQSAAREEHRRACRAYNRGKREGRIGSARRDTEIGGVVRVRLFAAADYAWRGPRGEPGRRMQNRAVSSWGGRGDNAIQLSQHGAEL